MKMIGKRFIRVEASVRGKRACAANVFGVAFGRQSTPLNEAFNHDGVLIAIERERIGVRSSKGPAFYDLVYALFPIADASKVPAFVQRMKALTKGYPGRCEVSTIKVHSTRRAPKQPRVPSSYQMFV